MFVLVKSGTKLMVSKPGRKNAYTNSYEHAQKFDTKAQAEANACGNEYPKRIDS